MASYLTDSEKSAYEDVMDNLHDTFSETVRVYTDASKTINTPNNSYNSIYGNAGSVESISYSPQFTDIQARVQYANNYNDQFFADEERDPPQLKIKIPQGRVRIKIKAEDYEVAKNGKRFEFDNRTFAIDSDFLGHGLFGTKFYTFFVKEIN
jgi:hypothetical protein